MAAYTTLAKVKRWLGLAATADEPLLTDLITAASAFIDQYTSRTLSSTAHTAYRSGNGHFRMVLPQYPITAVAALSIDGTAIPVALGATDLGYMIEHPNARAIVLRGYRFSEGVQNVAIAYTAGYVTLPADIEEACIELVGLKYREKDRIGQVSKTLAGEVVAFSQKDMSDNVRTALGGYINVVPA